MPAPTLTYRLYATIAGAVAPFAYRKVAKKLRAHDVAPDRIRERLGYATLQRPAGRLVWFHAASVGESLSILALIGAMIKTDPALQVLVTSGTATSAQILSQRMPANCRHQFAPLDSAAALRRFFAHWRPDLAVFVESELWPQMLVQTKRHGIPLALLNARLSKSSLRNWRRFDRSARYLLSLFSLIVAQTPDTLQALLDLGATPATTRLGDDLKAAAGAPPYDAAMLADLRQTIAARPVWVASSTHNGEESPILQAHAAALKTLPDLLLVLVPRHPERRDTVAALIREQGLTHSTRSKNDALTKTTQVYLADTLGETGLWYALAPLVFVGGSLAPVGGHNPYEPAHAGAAVLHGPDVTNFAAPYAALTAAGGCAAIQSADDLANQLTTLLPNSPALQSLRQGATTFSAQLSAGLDTTAQDLFALLEPARRT